MQADWEAAGGDEAMLEYMRQQFGSKELYEKLDGLRYLADACFAEMYGKDGSLLSDQEVAEHTAGDGYMMAKHILMMTSTTDETGNSTPMPDADKEKVRKEIGKNPGRAPEL